MRATKNFSWVFIIPRRYHWSILVIESIVVIFPITPASSLELAVSRVDRYSMLYHKQSFLIFGGYQDGPSTTIAKLDAKHLTWSRFGYLKTGRYGHGVIFDGTRYFGFLIFAVSASIKLNKIKLFGYWRLRWRTSNWKVRYNSSRRSNDVHRTGTNSFKLQPLSRNCSCCRRLWKNCRVMLAWVKIKFIFYFLSTFDRNLF